MRSRPIPKAKPVLGRIYAAGFKHVGIHHPAAQYLEPAGSLADVAALAVADVAAYVNLGRRLGEREERRPHADFGVGTEHLAGKQEYGLLEVSERHVFVYIQTFDLMEDAVRAGTDGLVSEHSARTDDADGKFHLFHRADLH